MLPEDDPAEIDEHYECSKCESGSIKRMDDGCWQCDICGYEPSALCDRQCNDCPIIKHPNSRLLTKIMNKAFEQFGENFYAIVQSHCPNLTCCYDCRIDDFAHVEGCKMLN